MSFLDQKFSGKGKYHMKSHRWNLKRNTIVKFTHKTASQTYRTNLQLPRESRRGRESWGCGMDMDALLYLKWRANGDLLY